ncbi:E3 ubiquitin-protein ligase RNF217 [Mixophyes fleayi]|uniref:E3 ubiquitin-protein ligase RNF217 n=1 Tax=Mixophyes fleayi TaxID=3061075 RepID=UPI003F4DD5BC
MGRRALGMGDQHEEVQHTQDMHTASSDEEEDEEEGDDGGKHGGALEDPYCLHGVIGESDDSQPLGSSEDPIDRVDTKGVQDMTRVVIPPDRAMETDESGPWRFTREVTGSSGGQKPKKRCSVLCTVYCVESDLSGDLPPVYPAEQRRLSDTGSRSSQWGTGELPLSPASLELELSPFLISSLGDASHKVVMSCRVCLENKSIKPLLCCRKGVCEECLKRYLSSQVQLGQVEIKCPITECNKHLDESTILYNLPHDDIIKYKYFLELSRMDSSTKPCPQCKHFTTFKRKNHIPTTTKSENKFKIQCPSCQFVWCFKCHSPWHEGVNCREYKRGDKLLRHWANEIEHGQRNAQKCPRCKVHIQRTEGCDHMTCSQCNTNFCYRCGERYRQLRFFGDHTSNLSIFGCKYRYLPERPHVRRLVRGSVCAGKLLITPLLLVIGLALGAIAVVIGLFGLPVYCLCKKQRKRTRTGMPW